MVFKRKIYDRLLRWKNESNGSSALLIEGARRIGKSTIVEEFAKNEYKSYILIDFNIAPDHIFSLFDNIFDLDYLFLVLQQTYRVTLHERESLIVFDEVQKCPKARQAIKYLVKDHRYDYIETGSLISIHKNTKDITIPSEEEPISMYPMDYEEFLWALGDEATMPLLRKVWKSKITLEASHRTAIRNLRLYMLVGGMPQAVDEYIKTNNLEKVDVVKRRIINLYAADFRKIDQSGKVSRLFLSIPSQLSRNIRSFNLRTVAGKVQANKREELLNILEDSKTVLFAHHALDPNVGFELNRDDENYKLFVCDTGLFVTMAFWDKAYTENIIYEKLLFDKLPTNLGYIYENLVAQMLTSAGHKLFYYSFPSDEKHSYEIDFLLSRGSKIDAIEVKSSGYKTHRSLDVFFEKYHSRIGNMFLFYTKELAKDEAITLVPFYLIPPLAEIYKLK